MTDDECFGKNVSRKSDPRREKRDNLLFRRLQRDERNMKRRNKA